MKTNGELRARICSLEIQLDRCQREIEQQREEFLSKGAKATNMLCDAEPCPDCTTVKTAGPKTASCTLTHEVRRFCHGDNDWSNWQPCTKEQAQEFSKSDCQVRLLVKPTGQKGGDRG